VRVAVSLLANAERRRGPTLRGTTLGLATTVRPGPNGTGPEPLRRALEELVRLAGDRVRDLSFVVEGAIPAGSGLGSSAALSVAMVRGVYRFFGETISEDDVVESALTLERVFHGNPSGVDHNVIARGGLLWFQRHESGPPTVTPIASPRPLRVVLALSGRHAGTASAVEALRARMRRHPAAYAHIFAGIGALVDDAARCLREGQLANLGTLMDLNQGYLNALGVSTPRIEALCVVARANGALGAKLTGAGGGGAMVALIDDDPAPVLNALAHEGAEAFMAEISTAVTERAAPSRADDEGKTA